MSLAVKKSENIYGGTTKKFIEFLKENGPQTRKQLEEQEFFGGVASRISKLVEQGRIEKIEVANPLSKHYSHSVVIAYKATENADSSPVPRAKKIGETYDQRVRHEKKERAVEKAIKLLEQQGYKVVKNS